MLDKLTCTCSGWPIMFSQAFTHTHSNTSVRVHAHVCMCILSSYMYAIGVYVSIHAYSVKRGLLIIYKHRVRVYERIAKC